MAGAVKRAGTSVAQDAVFPRYALLVGCASLIAVECRSAQPEHAPGIPGSSESRLASAPEVILVATQMGGGDRPLNGGSWNAWQSIPAVRSGRILSIPGDTIHRPGPRVVDGLERLARAIHPEAFLPGGAR